MLFAKPQPRCTVIVLARGADGTSGDAGPSDAASIDTDDIGRLLSVTNAQDPIEIFCARGPGVTEDPRLRWHPPTADLARALRAMEGIAWTNAPPDIAWVVARTRPPLAWDARLRECLHSDPAVGTVSPLCPDDPLYSPYDPSERRRLDDSGLDAWLGRHASDLPVQMPNPLPCCGVLRAEAAGAIVAAGSDGPTESSPWALVVTGLGLAHAACTTVAVRAPGSGSGKRSRVTPDPEAKCAGATLLGSHGIGDAHPLRELRRRIEHIAQCPILPAEPATPGHPTLPVRLHVSHSWGGGLSAWVRDFCDADRCHDSLVLRSIGTFGAFGQRLGLYRGSDSITPVRVWELGLPIHATATAHLEYRAVMRQIVDEFDVDSIIVSSLIGHSLDALRTGLRTLLVAHDHTPYCVAIYAYFGGECRSCDAARLRECIASNPGHRFFGGVVPQDWLALRKAFIATVLRQDIQIVAPSPSTAGRWQSLMPALGDSRFTVIAHGIELPAAETFAFPADERLRLVMLGRITEEKGEAVLREALPELLRFADLTLIGCGDQAKALARHPGVTAIASFDRGEIPHLIAQARPHLGLQLSTVPETFSYTLSELWHCGVPVLGSRLGSIEDRIRDGENGFHCEPNASSLLARLREIDGRRGELARIAANLRAYPQRDCAAMVADYDALLARRYPCSLRGARPAGAGTRLGVGQVPTPADHAVGRLRIGPVSVAPETTYLQALRGFADYTLRKAADSPRLPPRLRAILAGWLRRQRLRVG